MRNLKVSEELFLTERQVVVEERRLRTEDDPVNSLYEETVATAFTSPSLPMADSRLDARCGNGILTRRQILL